MPLELTAASTEWISIDELKAHANITSSTQDIELELMRDAAQDAVEALIGPVLWRTVTEDLAPSNGQVSLTQFPVVSVTSLVTAWSSMPVNFYTINLQYGEISLGRHGYGYPNALVGLLTATYVAGRASVPAAIRMAGLIIAAHLWETQKGNSPGGSALPSDDYSPGVIGMGYAIPARAMDLLAPYLRPPNVG